MAINDFVEHRSMLWTSPVTISPALKQMLCNTEITAPLPPTFEVTLGDCLRSLSGMPSNSVQCAITSPPYWNLRDYGMDGQLGLEVTPQAYLSNMVAVFRELRRVLREDGTLWLNIGDSYTNKNLSGWCKGTELVGMPWRLALALQEDGWYLRSEIIWEKPNPMPESVKNRPTRCHEHLFLFSKSKKYTYDATAIEEPAIWAKDKRSGAGRIRYGGKRNGEAGTGQESFVSIKPTRNKRTVWNVAVQHFGGAHFATFPEKLVQPCVLAGSKTGDIIMDLFSGSGTSGAVAVRHGRHFVGLELNPEYAEMSRRRVAEAIPEPVFSPFKREFPGDEQCLSLMYMLPVPLPFMEGRAGVWATSYIHRDFHIWTPA